MCGRGGDVSEERLSCAQWNGMLTWEARNMIFNETSRCAPPPLLPPTPSLLLSGSQCKFYSLPIVPCALMLPQNAYKKTYVSCYYCNIKLQWRHGGPPRRNTRADVLMSEEPLRQPLLQKTSLLPCPPPPQRAVLVNTKQGLLSSSPCCLATGRVTSELKVLRFRRMAQYSSFYHSLITLVTLPPVFPPSSFFLHFWI